MAIKLGLNAKLYYGPAGSPATTELGNCMDVTLNLEKGEADITTRGAQGWRQTVGTLKEGSVEFKMIWDPSEPGFTAIKNAYFNDAPIALKILDSAGGSGLDADFSVTKLTREEPLENALTASVTVKPTYSTRAPAWID
jgi:hypothetical protein